MSIKTLNHRDTLANALARYHAGFDPALIELPELAVFPHLIPAAPITGRKARGTGILLGKRAPCFVKRGRSIRYRLSDVLAWLESQTVKPLKRKAPGGCNRCGGQDINWRNFK